MRTIKIPRRMPMAKLIRLLAATRVDAAVLEVSLGARGFKADLDLELLALYSREHGLHLILSTPDEDLQVRATRVCLQVLPETLRASGMEAAAGKEKKLVGPEVLPLAVLVLAALLIVSSATVLLWPRTAVYVSPTKKRITLTVEAGLSTSYHESQIERGLLPVRLLEHSDLVIAETGASGQKTEGVTPAGGILTWLNDGTDPLAVPAGTQVRNKDGRRFRTVEAISIPAAKRRFLMGIRISATSGRAEVRILAEEPGTEGNLGPGTVTEIIGPLARYLRVINQAAMSGGTDRKVTVVTEADLDRAGVEAKRQAELRAPEELKTLAGSAYIILPETTAISYGHPNRQPRAGANGLNAICGLPYSASCLALSRTVLAKYLSLRAAKSTPAHFTAVMDSFAAEVLQASPRRPGEADLRIVSTYTAVGRLERARIIKVIRGKTAAEARQALLALPEVASVEIGLPRGGRLPRLALLIRLVLPKRDAD